MTIWTLGTDPGSESGAAVFLEGERKVLAWWTWQFLERKSGDVYRGTCSSDWLNGSSSWEARSMWEIADAIRLGVGSMEYAFCLEGLFVPRAHKGRNVNPQSVIPLAESAGEFVGGLRKTPDWRPLATEWRPLVLGLKANTPAPEAEAYAVKMAPRLFDWPKGQPTTKAERGALAEGACLARHGYIQQTALVRGNR